MAGNTYGTLFKVTTFGESHGEGLGCIVDGCPSGLEISEEMIQKALDRRRPGGNGNNPAVTKRNEADKVEILSGVFEGKAEGTPIALLIRNTNQHSKDYGNLVNTYRPGHADYTFAGKYDVRDYRGGGRSSGRETCARVAAGAIAAEFLKKHGIKITAYTIRAAGISCEKRDFSQIEENLMRCPDNEAAAKMQARIEEIRATGDSAGGVVECVIEGCPIGLGEPVFDKLDAELGKAMFSIGAVKGVEFGAGFAAADMLGSENNDQMHAASDAAVFDSNNSGGILGGISNGNKIVFRVGIKPVPSISKPQKTVMKVNETCVTTELEIKGRHDVCLCPRIVPVVEAMAAIVLMDLFLQNK